MTVYSANNQRVANGRTALAAYHNIMIDWYPKIYKISYDQLEKIVQGRNSDFLAQVGDAVISAKLGQRRLAEAMERVVDKTSTTPLLQIPDTQGFVSGIAQELSDFDFSLFGDAALDITKQLGKNSVELVESVGESAKDTVKGAAATIATAGKILPMVLIGIVGIILFATFNIAKNTKKVSDIAPKLI